MSTISRAAGPTQPSRTYTSNADFDLGAYTNVVHSTSGRLQINDARHVVNVIWVPGSDAGTVLKIDADTGTALGEYRAAPEGYAYPEPNHVATDSKGDAWVANRTPIPWPASSGSVVKIGLAEAGECVDRNNNGVIDTSTGIGDVRGWLPGNSGAQMAQDECILSFVRVGGMEPSSLVVDPQDDLWVASWPASPNSTWRGVWQKVSPSGQLLRTFPGPQRDYGNGAEINSQGEIWGTVLTAPYHYSLLRIDPRLQDSDPDLIKLFNSPVNGTSDYAYEVAVDSHDNIWAPSYTSGKIDRFDSAGGFIGTYVPPPPGGTTSDIAISPFDGNIWIDSSAPGARSAGLRRLDAQGNQIAYVQTPGPVNGIDVDREGRIWAFIFGPLCAVRVNPDTNRVDLTVPLPDPHWPWGGGEPGRGHRTARAVTSPPDSGSWSVVHDSGVDGFEWGRIDWNAVVPAGASLTVTAESSADGVNFGPREVVTKNQDLTVANGRYLRVHVDFNRASTGESPILDDVTIAGANQPPVANAGPDQVVNEGATVNLDGSGSSDPDADSLSYRWERLNGSGSAAVLSDNSAAQPSFEALDDSTAEFRLNVGDGRETASDTVKVNVRNVAPHVVTADSSAYAGQAAIVSATFSDPGVLDTHVATVDWGDGTPSQNAAITQGAGWGSLVAAHRYASAGSYHALITVTDDDGASGTAQANFTIGTPAVIWANRNTDLSALDLTGSDNTISGRVHSNGDMKIAGSHNTFTGSVEYADQLFLNGTGNSIANPPQQTPRSEPPIDFDIADYRPGGTVQTAVGSRYFNHTADCASNAWTINGPLPEGVHYSPCRVELAATALTGAYTIVSEKEIKVSGTGAKLTPYYDGLLFMTPSSANDALNISGSDSSYTGVSYAKAGQVHLAGSRINMTCSVIGDRISFTGQGFNIRGSACVRPSGTVAIATFVPSPTLGLSVDRADATPGDRLAYTANLTNDGGTLVASGLIGAENTGSGQAQVAYQSYTLEYLSAQTGAWVPLASTATVAPGYSPRDPAPSIGGVQLVLHPAASPGVTYPVLGADAIGATLAPTSLAAWGYQARVSLTADQASTLFDPAKALQVRNVVHLEFTPGASLVRELYRFGGDFSQRLRANSPDLANAKVTVVPPSGQPLLFDQAADARLAAVHQGQTVALQADHTLAAVEARGGSEPVDAYLNRLAGADGHVTRALARARAQSSLGAIYVPQQSVTTAEHVPVVSANTTGPTTVMAGDQIAFETALANSGSAGAANVAVNDYLSDGSQQPVVGIPNALEPGRTVHGTSTYDLPAGRTGPLASNSRVTWRDANGNQYGPVEDGYTLDVVTPPQLSVKKTAQLAVDADGNGQITPGDTLIYRVQIANSGQGAATGAIFVDQPDANTSLVPGTVQTTQGLVTEGSGASDSRARVALGALAGGTTVTITFNAQIHDPLPGGVDSVSNQGTLSTDQIGETLSDDPARPGASDPTVTQVHPRAPSIVATKSAWLQVDADADGEVSAGDTLGYAITVSNVGAAAASGVVVHDTPGAYTSLVAGAVTATGPASVSQGNGAADSSLAVNYAWLEPGAAYTTSFQVKVADPFPSSVAFVANQGEVTSDQLPAVQTAPPGGPVGPTITSISPWARSKPSATLDSPTDGQTVTEQTRVRATITAPPGESVTSWCVTARAIGGATRQLACGSGEVTSSQTLATFDPTTLQNGPYEIKVSATSSTGATDPATASISVEGNLKPGRYTTTYQDLAVPIHSLPIQVLRNYDSFDKAKGDFGVGWNVEIANFQTRANNVFGDGGWQTRQTGCLNVLGQNVCLFRELATDKPHFVSVRWPDGHTEVFDFKPSSGSSVYYDATARFVGRRGATSKLEVDGDPYISYFGDGNLYDGSGGQLYNPKRFKLTAKDGTTYLLDADKGMLAAGDRHGNSLTVDDNGITSSTGKSVAFTRDAQGRITKITGPAGEQVTYSYSPAGDLAGATDARGNAMHFSYDADHNLLTTKDPQNRPYRTITYDADGRMNSVTDGTGHTTQIDTNAGARQQVITSPDGRLNTVTSFDARGNLTAVADSFDGTTRTTSYAYDANDNPTRTTDPLGHVTSSTYDASGNQTATTDARGNTTNYAYDAANQLTKQTLPDGETTTITRDEFESPTKIDRAGDRVTQLAYDAGGLLTSVTDPLGRSVSFTHDAAGNTTRQLTPSGTTNATYDAANRLTSRTDAVGATTHFDYDEDGNLVKVTDANGGAQSYTYDYLGRLLTETDQLGHTTTYSYDAAGRVTARTDRNGQTENFSYDANGKLTSKTLPDGNNTQITYDGAGRPQVMSNADAQLNFAYDAADQITNATSSGVPGSPQPTTSIDYAYDAAGNRRSLTRAGQVTSYAYDSLNRLAGVTDASGGNFGFTRDSLGRIQQITRPNGVNTNYTWDAADQIRDIVHAASAGTLDEDHYAYNSSGLRTAVTDHNGAHNYTYDAAGQLTAADNPGAQPDEAYSYDALGNRISGGYGGQHYDAANRLTSDNSYLYAYDNEGNLTAKTDRSLNATTTYAWDAEHRLRSVTKPGGQSTSYRYDPLGRRIEVSGPSSTKRFAYGADQNYPVEYDGANNVAATYTFGLGMDTPLEMRRGGAASYYQQDALGTVTSLSGSGGAPTQRYQYGAFGQPQTASDSTGNPITYTGRELDTFSGDYFYRARWYDAGAGRFSSEDPLPALDGYSYVQNRPISLGDATGKTTLAEEESAISIADTTGSESASMIDSEAGRFVKLYRHMHPDELQDFKESGEFRLGDPNSYGKFFTNTMDNALKWGEKLNQSEGGVVEIRVPESFAKKLMFWSKLDNIGPAWFVAPEQMEILNQVMAGVAFV